MDTNESRSPPAVVSVGDSSVIELESIVKPVELELREKTLLLAFVWVESRAAADCRRLPLLLPVLLLVVEGRLVVLVEVD